MISLPQYFVSGKRGSSTDHGWDILAASDLRDGPVCVKRLFKTHMAEKFSVHTPEDIINNDKAMAAIGQKMRGMGMDNAAMAEMIGDLFFDDADLDDLCDSDDDASDDNEADDNGAGLQRSGGRKRGPDSDDADDHVAAKKAKTTPEDERRSRQAQQDSSNVESDNIQVFFD